MDRAELHVEVVYCPLPGVTDLQALVLAPGATVADAVRASGLAARHGLGIEGLRLGVWGKPRGADTVLRERDRVEIYRPLIVDPKEARRQRYQRHREKLAAR
ncbi:MAG: RnfH family protein [Rubrivivax sp.]|nr:RnfH family protein [Rubrivivax sp.]